MGIETLLRTSTEDGDGSHASVQEAMEEIRASAIHEPVKPYGIWGFTRSSPDGDLSLIRRAVGA